MNFVEGQRYRIHFPGDNADWLFTYIRRYNHADGRVEHCFHDDGQVEMSIADVDLQQCRVQAVA